MSLSSPGHAVSLFRGARFGKHVACEVVGRGLARHNAQTQLKVHLEANSRCKLYPKAAKTFIFLGSGRNVWHWRWHKLRSKNGFLELARPCCFSVSGRAFFWEACWVRSRGSRLGQAWRPNTTEGAFRSHCGCKLYPQAAKTSFSRGSGRNVQSYDVDLRSRWIGGGIRLETMVSTPKVADQNHGF